MKTNTNSDTNSDPSTPIVTDPNPPIHFPTPEEEAEALEDFLAQSRVTQANRRAAAETARPALARLIEVMGHRTGQSATVRGLLYSLYNGRAESLVNVVKLDWSIRVDLCAVVLGFGYENPRARDDGFFYVEMKAAIASAGLWEWFTQARREEAAAA